MAVDINDVRAIVTVLSLVLFIGICAWAFSRKAREGFDEAAMLPFTEDDLPATGSAGNGMKEIKNG